jgi:hypothetical protein
MKTLAQPHDRKEILERLQHVRVDSTRRWGRMSAHQMICHLADASRMAIGLKAVRPTGRLIHRTIVKPIALYVPVTWRTGILTNPEIDQECDGAKPVDFPADVKELESLVEVIASQPERLDRRVHPVFGRMSRAAWLRWAYLHMDHHLRQFGA